MQPAVSTPDEVMVPAAGATDQVKVSLDTRLPIASRAWAEKPTTPPAATVAVAGVTVTVVTAPTV